MNKVTSTLSFLKQMFSHPHMVVESLATATASLIGRSDALLSSKAPRSYYHVECFGADGQLKWTDDMANTVMTIGINDLLTQYFKGSAYTAAWFVGLVDNASFSAFSAADTSASHAGWLESAAYSNGTRATLTLGTASAGSINNSGAVAVFNINGTAVINGMFIITISTKSGTTGILYGAASFTGGNRSVLSGDTLNVTVTISAS
jgi:hypothetical protein